MYNFYGGVIATDGGIKCIVNQNERTGCNPATKNKK